ncbi:HEPN domain-containing protein [Heliorestis convoluta]|uniref:HEPN domain-containing protein n=1 Tax=Heliorestis convoluta TaxID=356322 RepID=A0A5Q2N775_9FIRM|nr:HEPN domain-containing protein [Heliorestis convoluta]QGG49252.1 HEPN domain-containing protein [Heliorestis convoluta]
MKLKTRNWVELAQEDYEVAGHLYEKKKNLYCLFFCQQAIEKALKAVYYEKFNETPPRKHDLIVLAKEVNLLSQLNESQQDFLDTLSFYYIESRYAEDRESLSKSCTKEVTKDTLQKSGEMLEWLKNILK